MDGIFGQWKGALHQQLMVGYSAVFSQVEVDDNHPLLGCFFDWTFAYLPVATLVRVLDLTFIKGHKVCRVCLHQGTRM